MRFRWREPIDSMMAHTRPVFWHADNAVRRLCWLGRYRDVDGIDRVYGRLSAKVDGLPYAGQLPHFWRKP
jgi:hypothetical protein